MLPILAGLNLTTQEVSIESIIEGNAHLLHPSFIDEKREHVMETFANEGYEASAKNYFKDNSERIRNSRSKRRCKVLKDTITKIIPGL